MVHKKKSIAIIVAIIFQIIAVVMAFSSFFLPIYRLRAEASDNIAGEVDPKITSEVQLLYREYKCTYTNNLVSSLDKNITNSYDDKPNLECLPFFFPNQNLSKIGYWMKISLAALAIGFIGSVVTLIFTIIMSCRMKCRNCGMKVFAFIFSIVPFVLYLLSPLVLLAITNAFHESYDISDSGSGSKNHQQSSSEDKTINLCTDTWCDSFYGSKNAVLPFIGLSGSIKYGPTYGWVSGFVASLFALISAILNVCSSRYKKHYHHNDYKSLLVNKY